MVRDYERETFASQPKLAHRISIQFAVVFLYIYHHFFKNLV